MAVDIEFKDLLGLSEPLCKLIKVVSNGIGTVYRPKAMRNEAAAEAERIKLIGEAKLDLEVKRIQALTPAMQLLPTEYNPDITERAGQRLFHKEILRQTNLEAIADFAADNLPPDVSSEETSKTWQSRFFNHAEDIAEPEMQELWGKILAGEVSKPGTFSLKTLDVMRNISQNDAVIFQRARQMTIAECRILKIAHVNEFEEFDLDYSDLLTLREAGLVHTSDMLKVRLNNELQFFVGRPIKISHPTKSVIELDQFLLTVAGVELSSLIPKIPNMEYFKKLSEYLKSEGYHIDELS